MAQLIVRNLEDDVRDKLRARAARHGRSMEEEIRDILRNAIVEPDTTRPRLGSQIAQRFATDGLEEDIAELRGDGVEPPSFDE
jgi:plasmid stability protein